MKVYVVVGLYNCIVEDISAWWTKKAAYQQVEKLLPEYKEMIAKGDAQIEVYEQNVDSPDQALVLSIDETALEKSRELADVLASRANRVSWLDGVAPKAK